MAKDIDINLKTLNEISVRIAEQTLQHNITDKAIIEKIAGITVKHLVAESMEHGDDVPGDFWEFIEEFWNDISSTEDPCEQAGYYAEWLFGKGITADEVVEDLRNGCTEEELEQALNGDEDDFGAYGFAHDIYRVYLWFKECHEKDIERGVVQPDAAVEESAPVQTESDFSEEGVKGRIAQANEEIAQLPWTQGIASVVEKYFPEFEKFDEAQRDNIWEKAMLGKGEQPIGEIAGGILVCNTRTRQLSLVNVTTAEL